MLVYVLFFEPVFKEPPVEALPSHECSAEYFGEIWLKYPLSERLWPLHHGQTFKAWAELYTIANRIKCRTYSTEARGEPVDSRYQAREYSELIHWFQNLPPSLTPAQI